jgi:hypothetical protein
MSEAITIPVIAIITNSESAAILKSTKSVTSVSAAPSVIVVAVFQQDIPRSGASADQAANYRSGLAFQQTADQRACNSASCYGSNLSSG